MTSFPPDPAGIFVSDAHRRVAGHLPLPDDPPIAVVDLMLRLNEDVHTPVPSIVLLVGVLHDLQGTSDAEESEDGLWGLAKGGLTKLSGPIADEPPPMEGTKLAEAEAANLAESEGAEASEKVAAKDRVDRLKAELAEAEEEVPS